MLRDSLVLVDEAAKDGPALDPLLGEVSDGVVGAGWAELAAAMGAPPVVVGRVLVQDRPQVPLAKDQHPVGDLVGFQNSAIDPELGFMQLARIR
jgi:hypothetical protein